MKIYIFFYLCSTAIFSCKSMEISTTRKSSSCDSPRLLENPELKMQATTFLTSLGGTTLQQENILIAKLEAACKRNDVEKAKQLSSELQQVHTWNEREWRQWQTDYTVVMQAVQQLQQQQLSQSSGDILDQNTRAAAVAAAAGSSEPTGTPERQRRRAFSLKAGSLFSRQSSGGKN